MPDLTILDLVANNTLSARIAAALWAAMDARLSFVLTAVPRFAGKSVVAENSQARVQGYIWAEPGRDLFETLAAGYSLPTALRAPDLPGAFDVLCRGNGVSDEAASRWNLLLYLSRFGDDPDSFWG